MLLPSEMELSMAPSVKKLLKDSSATTPAHVIEQLLKLKTHAKLETSRADTRYLTRARRPGREPSHKMSPSKQVGLVRHRLPRDLPRGR